MLSTINLLSKNSHSRTRLRAQSRPRGSGSAYYCATGENGARPNYDKATLRAHASKKQMWPRENSFEANPTQRRAGSGPSSMWRVLAHARPYAPVAVRVSCQFLLAGDGPLSKISKTELLFRGLAGSSVLPVSRRWSSPASTARIAFPRKLWGLGFRV